MRSSSDHYPGTWTLFDPRYTNWGPLATLLRRVRARNGTWHGKRAAVMETGFSTWNGVVANERDQAQWCNTSIDALRETLAVAGGAGGVAAAGEDPFLVNFYQLIDEGGGGDAR